MQELEGVWLGVQGEKFELNPLETMKVQWPIELVGVCRPHLPIQTQFQTKKMPFPTPVFRPGLKTPYPFSDLTLTLSISLSLSPVTRPGCGKKNKFISFHERSSDNHTQFQTKMFKIYTRFQTKTAQKPYPLGRHIPVYPRVSVLTPQIVVQVEAFVLYIVFLGKTLFCT